MASILLGIDNIHGYSADKQVLDEFASKLRSAGHNVQTFGVGPNVTQRAAQSHSADMMVQIAGGMCIGTLWDFWYGCGRYYKVKKASIPIYTKGWTKYNPETWKATRAWDDNFSQGKASAWYGKTLPSLYEEHKDKLTGWAHGKTVEEMANMFIKNIGGGTGNTGTGTQQGGGGGSSVFDAIKQVLSDIDSYGIDIQLDGDKLSIKKTNMNNYVELNENNIVNNSISFTDYDSNTPNVNNKTEDKYLSSRFGKIPIETEIKGSEKEILQMSQRGHGHSIDLKVIAAKKFNIGQWVQLTLEDIGFTKRPYYITKSNYDEEMVQSITLEPGPPSRYVEVTEKTDEENGDATE